MDIFGIDPENLNKIDIHNFEKSRRNKNLKNVVFSSKMLDDRVWALISPTIKKLETLVLQMPVTATHTSQCVSLAAICWKTPELWVVKNRFFSHFFRIFSDLFSVIFEFGWIWLFRLSTRTSRKYLLPILRICAKLLFKKVFKKVFKVTHMKNIQLPLAANWHDPPLIFCSMYEWSTFALFNLKSDFQLLNFLKKCSQKTFLKKSIFFLVFLNKTFFALGML